MGRFPALKQGTAQESCGGGCEAHDGNTGRLLGGTHCYQHLDFARIAASASLPGQLRNIFHYETCS